MTGSLVHPSWHPNMLHRVTAASFMHAALGMPELPEKPLQPQAAGLPAQPWSPLQLQAAGLSAQPAEWPGPSASRDLACRGIDLLVARDGLLSSDGRRV